MPSAEERFKEISEAYNVLSDEKRRKEYDDARSLFGGGVRMPGSGGGGGYNFDLGDLFGGGAAGGGRRHRGTARRPARRRVRRAVARPSSGRGAARTSRPRRR